MPSATACANIALVKYWGKKNAALNTPARGSLSLTLERLKTHTRVELAEGGSQDSLRIDGFPAEGRALERVTTFVDLVRRPLGIQTRVRVDSRNTFPTAAGLASSASAFAALAVATVEAFGARRPPSELSALARQGSGSAARSIFGGFARMRAGDAEDGRDAYAEPIEGARIELGAAIAVARAAAKKIGSTDGMEQTRLTSPFHAAWLEQVNADLKAAESALSSGDFDALAAIAEGNCLAMHANAMAARPGIIYFRPVTLWAIETVRRLRMKGTPVFFTIDAGPHVVAFSPPAEVPRVAEALSQHADVAEVLTSAAGGRAELVQDGAEG